MSFLTLLNLEPPKMKADFESNAPTGFSINDIASMEQFLIGVGTHSGQVVTPEKARRCSAVLACMRILSEDLASLRLPLYKHTPNGPVEVHDHPLHRLINVSPNDVMTGLELREHLIFDLILNGNFYVLKSIGGDGDITSLWPLQAVYCTRRWRELVWVFTDPVTGISGTFTPELVWRGTITSANALDGVAITLLAREAIGLLIAAEEQGARLFAHGVQSDLQLVTPDTLDQDAKNQLREAFQRRHAGSRNAWMPMLMEGGMKAKRIGLTAQESQYIEARNYQLGDIARVFRIPEVLLGSGTSGKSSTYASAEQFFNSYTKHTLTPWAVRLEQTMHRDLLSTREQAKYFFRHDFTSLLRADTAGRYESYSAGIAAGFLSPAECRRSENLPYVEGLDYYNKPQPTSPQNAEQDAQEAKPTDQSAYRLAKLLFQREVRYLAGGRYSSHPEVFYVQHAAWLEDNSGADLDSVLTYCKMRQDTADRFSTESQTKAIEALTLLCKKDS